MDGPAVRAIVEATTQRDMLTRPIGGMWGGVLARRVKECCRMTQQPVTDTLEDANQFDVTGPIVVSYSRTSTTGVPLVSYKDAERALQLSGDEIVRVDTGVGEFVTITVEEVPDAFVRTFTLVVPRVRVQPGEQLAFDTLAVETTDRSSGFVAPPGPAGVLQTYLVHQLHGLAQ